MALLLSSITQNMTFEILLKTLQKNFNFYDSHEKINYKNHKFKNQIKYLSHILAKALPLLPGPIVFSLPTTH